MRSRAVALFRRGLTVLPTIAILSVLGGLLAWGHHSHWKLPALFARTDEPGTAPDAHTTRNPEKQVVVPVAPAVPRQPPLYRIQFRSAASVRKMGIQVMPVEERPLTQHVIANGALGFDQTCYAELAPLAEGTVWKVFKQEGDPVRRGETLALVAAPAVARAKIEFLNAFLQVEVQANKLHRMEAVAGSIPEQQIRDVKAALREARLHLFESRQTLINFGLPIRSEELRHLTEEQAARKLTLLGVPDRVRQGADDSLLPSNLLPVIAPFDGEVIKRDMVIGEVVTSGQVQIIVANIHQLWVQLDVRLEDAGLLQLDQEVAFTRDGAGPQKAVGKITWISPAVDRKTRTVRVRAVVENPKRRLRPDTFGTGRILISARARAIVVPVRAVQRQDHGHVVFIRTGEATFEQRRIEPGITAEGLTEICSGLRPGEEVVTAGSHLLKSAIVHSRFTGGE